MRLMGQTQGLGGYLELWKAELQSHPDGMVAKGYNA